MNLSPSSTRYSRSITISRRKASSTLIPALAISSANTLLLPSATGGSSASISTRQLSIPMALKADIRCSMVNSFIPLASMVVALTVDVTLAALASIRGIPGRSLRTNTIPVLAGAGCNVICTSTPECNPTPV